VIWYNSKKLNKADHKAVERPMIEAFLLALSEVPTVYPAISVLWPMLSHNLYGSFTRRGK
jgi:hypothetical protein